MEGYRKPSVDEILRKYGGKLNNQIDSSKDNQNINYSREYSKFKEEMAPDLSIYEKWCRSLGSIIKLNLSKKDEEKIKKNLEIAHINVEPWQAITLGVSVFLTIFIFGLLMSVSIFLIKGAEDIGNFPFLFFILIIVFGLFLFFYEVEVGKFSTIKESLDNYLETWRGYSTEFIEAFHLIESSLFEPSDSRRISILEKSIQVVLDGVYDKMLKFTHSVRSPLTNVYMLGVVLPTLGLALLPLASAMIGGALKWIHIIILFNLIIPFFVFYLTDKIMMLRPGGYGETKLLEKNPYYFKYKSNTPYLKAFLISLPLFIIGFLPLIFQYTPIPGLIGLQTDYSFIELGLGFLGDGMFFDFKTLGTGVSKIVGPFGVGALVLSMFIPLGLGLFFSMAFKDKTKELILERENTQELEKEFNSSLFQLGNRIGSGTPPELVFGKVAQSSKGLKTENFFKRVNYNIYQGGMSVEKAIFDSQRGAIIYYPSDLIATSMRVLVESSKKGLKIAAVSLMSISEYVKNIQKITNRLKDLLAEIVSDMKSNMTFLAPLLSGIVIGLAAMIVSILNKLNLSNLSGEGVDGLGNLGQIVDIFKVTEMIPPYYLQIAIGIYLVQITFILTSTLITIDSGEDKLKKISQTGKNLKQGVLLYFITALISTLALFFLTSIIL